MLQKSCSRPTDLRRLIHRLRTRSGCMSSQVLCSADALSVPSTLYCFYDASFEKQWRFRNLVFCAVLHCFAKMPLKYALILTSYIGTLVLANPVHFHTIDNVTIIQAHPASDFLTLDLEPTSPSDESTLPSVTGNQDTHIHCDGASYGFDLEIFECEEAKAHFPVDGNQVQWAERHTGWQKRIFPLPYRAMGNKASCYVQPILIDGATSARASPNEVRNAAVMIRSRCYSGGKLQGGIATNIGEEMSLLKGLGCSFLSCEIGFLLYEAS